MARETFLLFYFAVLPWSAALAQPPAASKTAERQTSLAQLVQELREKNPEVQAARYRFEAATKRPSQVGSLPDPKLCISNFGLGHPVSPLNDSNFAYHGIGITQQIPFPGKLALASEEAKKQAESEREISSAWLKWRCWNRLRCRGTGTSGHFSRSAGSKRGSAKAPAASQPRSFAR